MLCPNCGYKYPAVIVYGYIVDENDNEYPYDPRVYEAGDSLPNWGVDGEYNGFFYQDQKWPTRFCRKCRHRFAYEPENIAMCLDYEEAINIANTEHQQITMWECIEKMDEEYPHLQWSFCGFVPVYIHNGWIEEYYEE